MSDETISRLATVLADVTGQSIELFGPDSAPNVTPGWDSIATLDLLVGIQETLGVHVPTQVALGFASLAELAAHVDRLRPARPETST